MNPSFFQLRAMGWLDSSEIIYRFHASSECSYIVQTAVYLFDFEQWNLHAIWGAGRTLDVRFRPGLRWTELFDACFFGNSLAQLSDQALPCWHSLREF
jgi:hypothetical protein